ncbi:MAG: hypothetical protein XXXJIFNMEKO3_01351 [Candidatus Erwinia impunctatus]|nr:hypothetical protein XXXJIFNMEKO_01351 [Culicoides impunctatus]
MNKTVKLLVAATLGAMSLGAWANTLKVGASNVPHAEILEQAKPLLAKQGIELEIQPFRITSCLTPHWPAVKLMPTISSTFPIWTA